MGEGINWEANLFEQIQAFQEREAERLGDDWIGIMIPSGLTDEEFAEYIALFNAGHRRKVSCRKEKE